MGTHASTAIRKNEILMAALASFDELGYERATVSHIRDRSGASVGSIYHHFGGKNRIAGALYLDGLSNYQRGLIAMLERHQNAERGIRGIVYYHLDWMADHPEWARFLLYTRRVEAVEGVSDQIRSTNRRFLADLRCWLSPHTASGAICEIPADMLESIIIGPSQDYTRRYLAGRARSDLSVAKRILARAAWASVRGRS